MKTRFIYIAVIIALMISGCGTTVVTDKETEETVTTDVSEKTAESENKADATEQSGEQAEEAEQNEDDKTIEYSFEFLFDPNATDPARSVMEDISVMTFTQQGIFSDAQHLVGKRVNSWTVPKLSVDHEKVILSEKGINDVRKIGIDMYNENFSDDPVFIIEAYTEASKIFAAGNNASDGFPIDYTEKSPAEIHVKFDDSEISIPVVKCELDERGYTVDTDDSGNPLPVLDTICIKFICKTDEIPRIKDSYLAIAEECEGNTEEPELSMVEINDAIVLIAPEEESKTHPEAQPKTDTDTTSDTGIVGKWYPVAGSDFSEYYIQIDEGGAGAIHRDGEVIPFSYSYNGKVVSINISSGGTNEFYYENGSMTSDFDGSVYKKR